MEQFGGAWVVHDTRISCLGGSCDFYRIRHCRRAASRASLRCLSAKGNDRASLPDWLQIAPTQGSEAGTRDWARERGTDEKKAAFAAFLRIQPLAAFPTNYFFAENAANFLLNFSTRPAVSMIFWLPV